jgi:hypothetical protein
MTKAVALGAVVALAFVFPTAGAAQGRLRAGEAKPQVNIVQSVGCAEQKPGSPSTWWLNRAAEPEVGPPGPFHITQVDKAKTSALGTRVFRLIGEADFLDAEGLLQSGQRAQFTTPETANASGQLRAGRKVLVKGLLIESADQPRINLMSVVSLAETCG